MANNVDLKLTLDTRQFNKAVDDSVTKMSNIDSKIKSSSSGSVSGLETLRTKWIGVAAGVGLVGTAFNKVIKDASNAEETLNKFSVVFGNVFDKANEASKELQDNYLFSKQGAQAMLASTGDLLTGLNVTQEKALELSVAAAKLGSDLASFSNFSEGAEGATERLTKAMLGEYENLKVLGKAINDTEMKKFAADQGLVWTEMDRGAKAALVLEAVMKQSGNAIGDVARSSESFANTMRLIDAKAADASASIGEQLLPAITNLARAFMDVDGEGEVVTDTLVYLAQVLASQINIVSEYVLRWNQLTNGIGATVDAVKLYIKSKEIQSAYDDAMNERLSKSERNRAAERFLNLRKEFDQESKALKKREEYLENYQKRVDKLYQPPKKVTGQASAQTPKEITTPTGDKGKVLTEEEKAKQLLEEQRKKEAEINKEIQERINLLNKVNEVANYALGIGSSLASLSQAENQAKIQALDSEMQKELEKAGLLEETQVQQAQRELDAAIATGNALDIEEKRRQLEKAKIEEKYAKKRRKLEYEAAMDAYGYREKEAYAKVPLAALQAYASGWGAGPALGPILSKLYAGMATASALIQVAAVKASKPVAPAFAQGVFDIPRDIEGATVHKGETIIPKSFTDSIKAGEMTLGNGSGVNITVQGSIIDSQGLLNIIDKHVYDKERRTGTNVYSRKNLY